MSSHEAFTEYSVVGYEEVQQFMDDNVVPDSFVHIQQLDIEIQTTLGGAGGPFVFHRPDTEPYYPDI